MTVTITSTTETGDCVAVPRKLAADAARLLDEMPGGGPIVARRLRPFLSTPPRREVQLDPRERFDLLQSWARDILDEDVRPEVIDAVIAAWAPQASREQWDEFVEQVRYLAGLESGEVDWREPFSNLVGCPAPEEIAIQDQASMVSAMAWLLVHPGLSRCVECDGKKEFPAPAIAGSDRCGPCATRRELRVVVDNDIKLGAVS